MSSWWNDYESNVICGMSFEPGVQNSSNPGAGIDLKEAELGLHATVAAGNFSGTAPTLDVTLEEAVAQAGPWTAVNDFRTGNPVAFDQITADALAIKTFKRSKQFVRAVATIGGTTPAINITILLCGLRKAVRKFGDPVS